MGCNCYDEKKQNTSNNLIDNNVIINSALINKKISNNKIKIEE